MTKWILALALVLLVAGCAETQLTAWTVTGQETDLTTRVGLMPTPGVQAGVTAKWARSSDIHWGPEPQQIGPYCILEASWLIQADDTAPPAPPPISWLSGLRAVPYAGADFVDDIDNDNFGNLQPNWIFGTKFLLDDEGKIAIVAEYIDGDQTRSDVNVGMTIAF